MEAIGFTKESGDAGGRVQHRAEDRAVHHLECGRVVEPAMFTQEVAKTASGVFGQHLVVARHGVEAGVLAQAAQCSRRIQDDVSRALQREPVMPHQAKREALAVGRGRVQPTAGPQDAPQLREHVFRIVQMLDDVIHPHDINRLIGKLFPESRLHQDGAMTGMPHRIDDTWHEVRADRVPAALAGLIQKRFRAAPEVEQHRVGFLRSVDVVDGGRQRIGVAAVDRGIDSTSGTEDQLVNRSQRRRRDRRRGRDGLKRLVVTGIERGDRTLDGPHRLKDHAALMAPRECKRLLAQPVLLVAAPANDVVPPAATVWAVSDALGRHDGRHGQKRNRRNLNGARLIRIDAFCRAGLHFSVMRSPNIKYLPAVDHLRGMAALLIVFYHGMLLISQQQLFGRRIEAIWPKTTNPIWAIAYEGHTAVSLFMVLSGFIFAFGSRHSEIEWSGFIKNRILRIVPLSLTIAVVGLYAFPAAFTLSGMLQHAALMSNLPGATAMGPFSQMFWTIAVEFQFYLICPFLILFIRNRGIRYGAALIGVAMLFRLAAVLNGANARDLSYWTIVGRIDQFVLGILLGLHFDPNSLRLDSLGLVAVVRHDRNRRRDDVLIPPRWRLARRGHVEGRMAHDRRSCLDGIHRDVSALCRRSSINESRQCCAGWARFRSRHTSCTES